MRIQELSPAASSPDNVMTMISMKVLDMALDTLNETGAGLTGMIADVPTAASDSASTANIMTAEHIDMLA